MNNLEKLILMVGSGAVFLACGIKECSADEMRINQLCMINKPIPIVNYVMSVEDEEGIVYFMRTEFDCDKDGLTDMAKIKPMYRNHKGKFQIGPNPIIYWLDKKMDGVNGNEIQPYVNKA